MFPEYDIIVIGLGHAGAECAHAAAKMGSKVLGVDPNRGYVKMSCNNSIGGIAKGQIVREIDALGGMAGIIADKSTFQFRMLNQSKGPAMWSPRSQNDAYTFGLAWQKALEAQSNLHFWQDMVTSLLLHQGKVTGVKTSLGLQIKSKAVILTTGTFLNGRIHIGNRTFGGGRINEKPSLGIAEQLAGIGFEVIRLNTGTPPRVDERTLDYSKMEEQPSDPVPSHFSFIKQAQNLPSKSVYITYTNENVHDILTEHLNKTPNLNGSVQGQGPQYCVSIETKIQRFAHKKQHQIFVQPMGVYTSEVYVNGFTTAYPEHIQHQALRHVKGFENVRIFRPGYTIEYNCFNPTQLNPTLETKLVENLYFAGQINGTTGYEEAGCQGLMAGANAHLKINKKPPLILKRSQAYIGVLIDDLVHKGTQGDPYRMFTSRAEHRMLLRQDNADLRLTALGYDIGLASKERYQQMKAKKTQTTQLMASLNTIKLKPAQINPLLQKFNTPAISESKATSLLLKRPQLSLSLLLQLPELKHLQHTYTQEALKQAEIQITYAEYLEKEQKLVDKLAQLENHKIPADIDYTLIHGLSNESRERLQRIKPLTLGAASRITGVSPADTAILMVYLGR